MSPLATAQGHVRECHFEEPCDEKSYPAGGIDFSLPVEMTFSGE
ncbi:MAG: hypothetical protein V1897_08765 [Pseudomonadota bacterium]